MIGWITGALPFIIGAVRWVEKLLGAGKGDEKLRTVLELLNFSIPDNADSEQRAEINQGITMIVNGVVKVFNASGIFQKS